jgi:hypothetical protein
MSGWSTTPPYHQTKNGRAELPLRWRRGTAALPKGNASGGGWSALQKLRESLCVLGVSALGAFPFGFGSATLCLCVKIRPDNAGNRESGAELAGKLF